MADARALAAHWTVKEPSGHGRALFDHTVNATPLLLAALVVALRSDHQLVERLRSHFPDQLEELTRKCSFAEVQALASAWAREQPPLKASQKYERDHRRKW